MERKRKRKGGVTKGQLEKRQKGIRAARKRGHATPWRRCRPFLFTKFDRLLESEMHPSSNPSWKTKRAWCSLLMNWRNWKISAIVQKNLKIVKEIYREKIFFSFIYPPTSYNTYLQRLKRISLIFVIIRIHCFIYRVDLILFINACKYPLPINNNYDTT